VNVFISFKFSKATSKSLEYDDEKNSEDQANDEEVRKSKADCC